MTDSPRLPAAYLTPGTSSFVEFLAGEAPDLLPSRRSVLPGNAGELALHGTTIVAATYPGGVVMAGDRRATMGNIIAQRDIEKVFRRRVFLRGHRGSGRPGRRAGAAVQTELEHYEKIEGVTLSMDGKANRLAALIRSNLGMAMQARRRAAVRRVRPSGRPGPDLLLRRDRRTLRGDGVRLVGSGSLFARGR
ncbi:MAG: hypothetical protein R2731_01390 [Nocardioides sp.]